MKAEFIVTVMLTSFCLGERRQRSTVLTDESKRVLEHFDFSNFDKQEALNNIERQRYENQIRGKRSQTKIKKDDIDYEVNISDATETADPEKYLQEALNYPKKVAENLIESGTKTQIEIPHMYNDPSSNREETTARTTRSRVGRRSRKKHKFKTNSFANNDENKEGERKSRRKKRRKKKKKKKRKRRYWDDWTEWSPCSVTCGRGRKIRWRKCIVKNCNTGELEMGEKTCQLPACNLLTKLLGL